MINVTHNCRQCAKEWLGRCFGEMFYGKDVSVNDNICTEFIDGRSPDKVTFDTLGQLENYLRENFYSMDFCKQFTRPKLRIMLMLLYPHTVKDNSAGIAFSNMCKTRMVKHIEFYINLHGLKCIRK